MTPCRLRIWALSFIRAAEARKLDGSAVLRPGFKCRVLVSGTPLMFYALLQNLEEKQAAEASAWAAVLLAQIG